MEQELPKNKENKVWFEAREAKLARRIQFYGGITVRPEVEVRAVESDDEIHFPDVPPRTSS